LHVCYWFCLLDLSVNCASLSIGTCQFNRGPSTWWFLSLFTRIWSFFVIAGSFSEWRGKLTRNFGFAIDLISLLMSLGHYSMIFWLRGMAFHLVDAVLLLNLRVSDLLLNNWIMLWCLHNIFIYIVCWYHSFETFPGSYSFLFEED